MITPKQTNIVLMADVCCEPLWYGLGGDELDMDELDIPAALKYDVRYWAGHLEQLSLRASEAEERNSDAGIKTGDSEDRDSGVRFALDVEGFHLAGRLQAALGQNYRVHYFHNRRRPDLPEEPIPPRNGTYWSAH